MKILLSTFACEPGLGSEEGVGWNTVIQTANYHETWVLTRNFCRPFIEEEVAKNPNPNLHFVYLDPFGWSEDWKGRQGLLQLHYYLWQIWAYFIAKKLHQEVGFDIVRHVTYVKHWSPSFVSLLPVPFIWGPVGGAESAPRAFFQQYSRRGKIYEILRDMAQGLGERDPFAGMTARRSALALATTEQTADRLRWMGAKNVKVFSQVGLSKAEIEQMQQDSWPADAPVRFITVSRLLHWKGVQLSLQAFAKANLAQTEFWIVGDGPERQRLETLAVELGIAERVKFWGNLPRQETLKKMGEAHALLHPSLHESGGFVCAEAMTVGRPVICLDLGGPAVQVTDQTGFKVPAHNPEQAVEALAEAITRIATDAELRVKMGQAGQQWIKEMFDWDVKGRLFDELYQDVVAQKGR